ncbi:hypothetical protein X777_05743, partial [Ooceraea biroi]
MNVPKCMTYYLCDHGHGDEVTVEETKTKQYAQIFEYKAGDTMVGNRQEEQGITNQRVLDAFHENPGISVHRTALEFDLSRYEVHSILRQNELHPYHYQRVQQILPRDVEQRIYFCEGFLAQCRRNVSFPDIILWTDESTFTSNGVFNYHNSTVAESQLKVMFCLHDIFARYFLVQSRISLVFKIFEVFEVLDSDDAIYYGRAKMRVSRLGFMPNDFLGVHIIQHLVQFFALYNNCVKQGVSCIIREEFQCVVFEPTS